MENSFNASERLKEIEIVIAKVKVLSEDIAALIELPANEFRLNLIEYKHKQIQTLINGVTHA